MAWHSKIRWKPQWTAVGPLALNLLRLYTNAKQSQLISQSGNGGGKSLPYKNVSWGANDMDELPPPGLMHGSPGQVYCKEGETQNHKLKQRANGIKDQTLGPAERKARKMVVHEIIYI